MDPLHFTKNIQSNITLLPNEFIDHHMPKADGEYVKIYLLLLRLVNQGIYQGPEQLADTLELTQKDVNRALAYWEKEGLIQTETKAETNPASQIGSTADRVAKVEQTAANPAAYATGSQSETGSPEAVSLIRQTPGKSNVSPKELNDTLSGTDIEQTLFMVETYFGRPLSHTELESIYYMNKQLGFSTDLLEYLIEYSVTKGKKSMRYIESVAINWYQQGISTVAQAKEESASYTQNVFPIMKAFGITNRNLGPAEMKVVQQWNSLGFDSSIIIEACNRTMMQTHQPSFPYATKILVDWKNKGVRSLKDIQALDEAHQTKKGNGNGNSSTSQPASGKKPANAFHNFQQREYDYDDLEARLQQIRQSTDQ